MELIGILVVFGVPVAIGLIAGFTVGTIAGRRRRDSRRRRAWACWLGLLGSLLGGFVGLWTEAKWEWIPIRGGGHVFVGLEQLLLCALIGTVVGAISMATLGAFIGAEPKHGTFGMTVTRRKGRVVVGKTLKDLAAEKAGLREGDVILTLDGKPVRSTEDVAESARQSTPGDVVKIEIDREGKTETIAVVLGDV